LGPNDFGLMNYVISYVTLFSILSNFGLDSIEIRELSKNNVDKNSILGTALAIRLFFSLITIVLIIITLVIFESDRFTFLMVIIYSGSLILSSLNIIRNYFTSIILNEYVVKTEIIRTIIGAAIKIVFLICHTSLTWFIVANTFDFFLVAGGYLFSYRKKIGLIKEWKYNKNIAIYLIRESFPMLLSGAAIIIYQKIDQIMIHNMIGNVAVGNFSVASKILELAIFVPAVISQTVTPLLVQAHQENILLYQKKRQQFMDIMVWSGLGISLIISITAGPAIQLLFGTKYLSAIPVLQIMSWKTVFVALFSASGQIIIIENMQKFAAIRNVVGCFVSVLLNLLLIPKWGIIGSAYATILTMAFSGYFSHIFIKPYFYILKLQNRSILYGLKNIIVNNKK
jgi:O-antigen/teichoic acid export membrane protein